jgi:hypothetical protein
VPSYEARPLRKLLQSMLRDGNPAVPIPNANWNVTLTGHPRYLYWVNVRTTAEDGKPGLRFYVRVPPGTSKRHRLAKDTLVSASEWQILRILQEMPKKSKRVVDRFFSLGRDPVLWKSSIKSLTQIFSALDNHQLTCLLETVAERLRQSAPDDKVV